MQTLLCQVISRPKDAANYISGGTCIVSTIHTHSANTAEHSIPPSRSASRSQALDVIDLTVLRCRTLVLDNVHLSIALGDSVALMGPNGAGKSTLLKCLAGQIRPDAGAIRWFGTYTHCSSHIRRRIGFLGHEQGLYPDLTPEENLLFAARMHGIAKPCAVVREALANAGLEHMRARLVRQLSQGTRQRLAIMRATIHDPEIVLLDEPFASLDVDGRDWLADLFSIWREAGRSVCFVSHDEHHATTLASRILRCDAGNVAADRTLHPDHLTLVRSA